jgi:hypothetical protein
MQFEISEFSPVTFSNFNARTEKHGAESVPAADLTFTMDAPNSVLDYFYPGLLEAMYAAPAEDDPEEQEELDGVEPISNLPLLKFAGLEPLKIDKKLAGYTLAMEVGLDNLEIEACSVGKFTLDLKEGGTVALKFQVQCQKGLTEQIMGKLAMLNGQELKICLLAPVVTQATTEAGENPFPVQDGKTPQLTAEDVFVGQSAAVH